MEGVRALSFLSYVLVSVQMTFNFLIVDTIYPQNFYEVLRVLCAGYISTIPPYNQLNPQYTYSIFYIPVSVKLVTAVPNR